MTGSAALRQAGVGGGVAHPHRPGFTLKLSRCVGCGACVLACRIENRLPANVSWRRVLQVNEPRIGGGPTYHLSVACHHCEHPPCVTACPSGALEKRLDGLVVLGEDRCIGCRYCEMACPFGAPSFHAEAGVMTKCHLCHHRLEVGSSPACVTACPTNALEYVPPRGSDHVQALAKDKEGGLGLAAGIPGFGDPGGAEPGFWVAEPGGDIRAVWFGELMALMGLKPEGSHEPT